MNADDTHVLQRARAKLQRVVQEADALSTLVWRILNDPSEITSSDLASVHAGAASLARMTSPDADESGPVP